MSKRKKPPIPIFEQAIIETHCHLDYLKDYSLDELLERSREVGIEKIITIAVSPDNLEKVMKLATENPMIWGTQGVHPHDADKFTNETRSQICENAQHERILAIGEIGLDYFYEHSDRKTQSQVFESQLQIASDMDLPVVIHSRDADDDMMAILKNFESSLKKRGVIHSFTSGPDLAQYALDQGFCLGFNGICTFNTAENVRDIIRMTPLQQIILETDAPYLTPVPYRGKENASFYLPFVAQKVADVKELAIEELLTHAYQNSDKLFFNGKGKEL
ncbi:hydrolase TatD [Bermanella sp. 47_1433_sub80_T6]|nr:hydrolase TatD [Bermanella sp. 47_1433_sub80_T6]